jgi:hypothetical protein
MSAARQPHPDVEVNCVHALKADEYFVTCEAKVIAGKFGPLFCRDHCGRRQAIHADKPALIQITLPKREHRSRPRPITQINWEKKHKRWVAEKGRRLWKQIEAHDWEKFSLAENQAYLVDFYDRVPCGDCKAHWGKMLRAFPPPLNKPQKMREWSRDRHNDVNIRIGKSIFVPGQPWASESPLNLADFFDAIYVINLDRDDARWKELQAQIDSVDWPFSPVTRFPAADGQVISAPPHFRQGKAAWACLQSHRRILEDAVAYQHYRVLIIEDDADFGNGFTDKAAAFLEIIRDEEWDCLMLGGQHIAPPASFLPGVIRCVNTQRTHCYAVQGKFIGELLKTWSAAIDGHCDWSLGQLGGKHLTLAPEKFIVGQRGGLSSITSGVKPAEWWNGDGSN